MVNPTVSCACTASVLPSSSRTYNTVLVPALDRAMRKRGDPMDVFKKMTGKDADELWKEYTGTL